jgi:UDP-N-acetylglucosamine 2-epimerase (non-hydrolysing)
MKIISIVGARPQFIKCSPVSKELRKNHQEILVHTGQHYDDEMSKLFFDELHIPKPDYNLGVGSGLHGEQTGKMLIKIEKILLDEKPDFVLIYGDTNSTVAGALAAAKLHIPIGHVEAGLRSFDRFMPEEINRIVSDHVSDILLAPTATAVKNLQDEGISKGVYNIGDVMYDALLENISIAEQKSSISSKLNVKAKDYLLATLHRPSNTDEKKNLSAILSAFSKIDKTIVFPVHPRTMKFIKTYNLIDKISKNVIITKPLGYLDFIFLEKNASKILTDSGGIQKEAYLLKVPCITLRESTEWIETVRDGWNVLVGASEQNIVNAVHSFSPKNKQKEYFGNGDASKKIKEILEMHVS